MIHNLKFLLSKAALPTVATAATVVIAFYDAALLIRHLKNLLSKAALPTAAAVGE